MGSAASTTTIQISDVDRYYSNLSGCTITKTEERGITIRQLELVMMEITVRCEAEGWVDYNNNKLTPDDVNLYTVNEKVIIIVIIVIIIVNVNSQFIIIMFEIV